jgi:hypothetical protein
VERLRLHRCRYPDCSDQGEQANEEFHMPSFDRYVFLNGLNGAGF